MFSKIYADLTHLKLIDTKMVLPDLYAVKTGTVNFYIYKTDDCAIIFDSGYGKSQILRQLKYLDIKPEKITHIFLTHSDFDHMAGVRVFKNAEICLSAEEYNILLKKKARMPWFYQSRFINRQCRVLFDGEEMHVGNTVVKAVSTPGHTVGSMTYLLNNSILFTGDTLRLENNKIFVLRRYSKDTEIQEQSIKKLADINAQYAFTGHSGYTDNFYLNTADWRK
ncbi:MAG: MBL fold metallo-hydrolase [Eubacteriaceae bacterium]|nr:MBL fold metallo-hydrolase [Eubacteriaceae bacterium]